LHENKAVLSAVRGESEEGMLFINELPKSVITLILSLAEAYYKEQYPDMEIDEIREKTSDLENEKIKDMIPLLQEYTDELYGRS
jgi:hypothetical protein